MKVLLCPDKFKGSISADKVCIALRQGLLSVNDNLQIVNHPMADGGDGSIEILKSFLNLTVQKVQTVDPLGRSIVADYYYSDEAAFIELAGASGLVLLDEKERNPLNSSTRGTGEMIKDALMRGFRKIYLFIGGSATNDGGIGIAQAMGFDFLDDSGVSLEPIGLNLEKIHKIEYNGSFDFDNIEITVLCDVTNPMHGPEGAAFVYAPQKGASPNDILDLDDGLKNYAELLKSRLMVDISDIPGMGAAGAVSASLVGLLNARLENGFQLLAKITQLGSAIKDADLVITGEGKIDATSFQGKVVGNVSALCQKFNIPCGIVGGVIEEVSDQGADFVFQKSIISLAKDLNEAISTPEKYLIGIGADIGKSYN